MKSLAKKAMLVFATALVITIFPSNPNRERIIVAVHAEDVKAASLEIEGPVRWTDAELEERHQEKMAEKERKEQERRQLLGVFEITAYCKCRECNGKWKNAITTSGATAQAGRTVAINGVPFGTVVEFEGHQYVVEDRGGGLGTTVVDLYMDTHAETERYGRHRGVEVYIIKEAE